jgi:glycosyltransferase involved in cell wall biosynthesis
MFSRCPLLLVMDAPGFGGAERYVLELSRHLVKRGLPPALVFPETAAFEALAGWCGERGLAVLRLPRGKRLNRAGLGTFRRFVEAVRPALVHFNLHVPFSCRALIETLAGSRLPLAASCQLPEFPLREGYRHEVAATLARIDHHLAIYRGAATVLEQRLGVPRERVTTVCAGVEVVEPPERATGEAFRQAGAFPPGTLLLGVLGHLEEQKDVATFLRGLARLRERAPEVSAVIVGEGYLRRELEGLAGALGLTAAVRFLGYREDYRAILGAVDILVHTAAWEGFPYGVLEAMARGRPVVATAVGGLPEMVAEGETGLLVPPRDPEQLACALETLVEDAPLRADMGRRGRERVRRLFAAERWGDEMIGWYRRILSDETARACAS